MPRGTREAPRAPPGFAYGPLTLCGEPFQVLPLPFRVPSQGPPQPRPLESRRFGLLPFRSPLLGESLLISSPPGTEMFQFPGFASLSGWPAITPAGLPHSDTPGSKPAWRLPGAFRSPPRPSSPLDAKASTVRPSQLDHPASLRPESRRPNRSAPLRFFENNPCSVVKERSPAGPPGAESLRRPALPPGNPGGGRARTVDLLRARQALSRLSYAPPSSLWWA